MCILILMLSTRQAQAQDIRLTPTFESIGIELPINVDENSTCNMRFREAGGEWREGLPLFTDHETNREGFRGSVVLLEPDTEYEIELSYTINGSSLTKTATTRTWSEAFPEAEVIPISSRQELKDKLKSGSASKGYVVFDGGTNKTVIDGGDNNNALDISNKEYIIIKNMEFKGSRRSAIRIYKSNHIVVQDCDINNWGEAGNFCGKAITLNGTTYKSDGEKHAGVEVEGSSQIVVQYNTIHDPTGNSCNWESIPKKYLKEGEESHPSGPRGIAVRQKVKHSVFRYNRAYSTSQDHYFADVFNAEERGATSDIDVYGNEFSNAWDDGIEIEDENRNIRVWNNVVHSVYHGLASDRNGKKYYGPVYIWRNIFTNLQRTPSNQSGRAFKLENREGKGAIYLFNNTISGLRNYREPTGGISNNNQYNVTALNNIFDLSSGGLAYNDEMKPGGSDLPRLNYNAYSHDRTDHMIRNGWEKDSEFNVKFSYNHSGKDDDWNYYAQNEAANGTGIRIPNFIEAPAGVAVDLGAAQDGVWSMCAGPEADCTNDTNNPPPKPEPEPEPPGEPVEVTYAVVPAERAPSLSQSYWAAVPGHTFADPTGRSDNRVEFKAIWNEDYLIIGVSVDDRLPLMADPQNDPWRNDAVQLFFDPDNTGGQDWNHHQLGHRQLVQDVGGKRYSYPQGFGDQSRPYGKTTTFGYLLEVRIPWSALGEDVDAVPGLQLGFDVANDDLDESADGPTKYQFTYTGRVKEFRVPARFATLKLGEKEGAGSLSARVFSGAGARQLAVYPNPTSEGSVQLKLSGFTGETQVQVTDTQGQVVYRRVHTKRRIELAQSLPPGLYVVRVSDTQGTLTEKLLVE